LSRVKEKKNKSLPASSSVPEVRHSKEDTCQERRRGGIDKFIPDCFLSSRSKALSKKILSGVEKRKYR
jgi:hypothetical protein